MSLRSEVESTRDRFSSDLKKAHDYYIHTKVAWRIVHLQIEQGTKFQVQNINTGSEVSEAQFLELSRRYITQELPIATLEQCFNEIGKQLGVKIFGGGAEPFSAPHPTFNFELHDMTLRDALFVIVSQSKNKRWIACTGKNDISIQVFGDLYGHR